MLNIIKSQMYGIFRDMYTYICLLITGILLVCIIFTAIDDMGGETLTGSMAFIMIRDMGAFCGVMSIMMFASRLCGWDLSDKTVNYEVLYGHKRSAVYWSRVIVSITLSVGLALIFMFAPVLIAYLVNGWGYTLEKGEAIKRGFLEILPVVRLAVIIVFMSVIFRSSWTPFMLSFVIYIVESLIQSFLDEQTPFMCFSCLNGPIAFSNFTSKLIDDMDVTVCTDMLSSGFVTGAVAVCLAEIVLFLGAGCILFQKRDMN